MQRRTVWEKGTIFFEKTAEGAFRLKGIVVE